MFKSFHAIGTKIEQTMQCLFESLFYTQLRFRIELIGITNQLLLHRFRRIILQGQRKMLCLNISDCNTRTCMALCYPCMTRHPFLLKHFGSDYSVTNIMLSAITINGRSVGLNNADIVEHCSLVDKCSVEV